MRGIGARGKCAARQGGRILAVAVVVGLPLGVPAASVPVAQAPPDPGTATARILAHEQQIEPRTVGVLRLRASYPQGLSAGIGLLRARQPADYDCTMGCDHRGVVLQVEPGLRGIQLGAGWGLVIGDKRTNRTFLRAYHVGFGVKGVALRTWGDAPESIVDETWLGLEGDFSVASASFSLGVLRAVSPDEGKDDWMVSGGLGWGF